MSIRGFLLLTAILLLGSACGRKQQDSNSTPPDSVATPAQSSLGVRVTVATDPYLKGMAPRLGDWVERWRRVIPGFSLDSLRRESSRFPLGSRRAATKQDFERARIFGEVEK